MSGYSKLGKFPKKNNKTEAISIKVRPELKERVVDYASDHDLSLTTLVEQSLEHYLRYNK